MKNPNDADCNRAYGRFFYFRGLIDHSIFYLNKAIELDPLSTSAYISLGLTYQTFGKASEAEKNYQKALEIDPDSYLALGMYASLLGTRKNYEKAERLLSKITDQTTALYKYWQAFIHAAKQEREETLKIMEDPDMWLDNRVYTRIPFIYNLLGMNTMFFETFIRADNEMADFALSQYLSLNENPLYDHLRDDPRFHALLSKHKKLYEKNLKKYGESELTKSN
jgi:tetratricopeptide (TPR) repeat protein